MGFKTTFPKTLVPKVELASTFIAYKAITSLFMFQGRNLERLARIELAIKLWQSFRFPLQHSRIKNILACTRIASLVQGETFFMYICKFILICMLYKQTVTKSVVTTRHL
jgi:hypothetical protein